MPAGGKPVLTSSHKLLGNLVPLAVMAAVALLGGLMVWRTHSSVVGWFLLLVSPMLGWLTVNMVGLWDNRRLRSEIEFRLKVLRPRSTAPKYFVGFARPSYRSALDPHEDVGFLIFHEDRLEFYGGDLHINIYHEDFREVRTRSNPHTWLGLGGWISIEGFVEGQKVRMLLEPREHFTLVGNRRWAKFIKMEISKWAAVKPLMPVQIPDIEEDPSENPTISTLLRSGTRLL